MQSGCDYLIIPHDDNRFLDPKIPSQVEAVITHFGDSLGWIGSRDGYGFNYADIISSKFSTSDLSRAKLGHGEFAPRLMLNTGPMVYTRRLVEKIGLPDPDLSWYWWDDYSLRAHTSGLINVLLGMDCAHEKFGQLQPYPPGLYAGETVSRDLERFRDRWRPVLGRNPL